MAKQKKAHRRLDPEDVLEGRARPSAQELLALIHDVNPSGHELPARESARRYAQKSRLQSLLVRRFPDEIVVEPGDAPGVVGLRHRSSGADACHAVIASLDDDARSWVQLRIDLGEDEEAAPSSAAPRAEPEPEPSGPPSDAPLDALSTAELLTRGRAALDAYDYDAARERFSAALDRGSREAPPLLLTVLVEHLGLDAEALGVEERLDAEALKRSDVRALLALAAARGYERDRAVRLVRADEGDAAADVFAALARGAIERGELDLAARDVAEIQRRGPSHPALLELGTIVKKRRAEERAPLEAEAQRLLDEGRLEEAEAKAAALVARWPESAAAHAVARGVEDRRRRAQARAMAAEARAALDRNESARALTLLRRAVAMGLQGEEAAAAEKDLARAEAAERSREAWDRAGDVVRVLREGHVQRGLVEYVALDDPRRDLVKANVPLTELVYLDQAGVRGAGPEVKAAVQAVMALRRAIAILSTDAAGALDLIVPHRAILEGIPHGVDAITSAQQAIDVNDRLTAERRLHEGMDAMHFQPGASEPEMRECLTRGLKVLATVRREHLDASGRDLLDRLIVSTRRMLERWDRAKRVGKLRKDGDLMGARDALDELIRFEEAGAGYDRPPGLEDGEDAGPRHEYAWRGQREDVVKRLLRSAGLRVAGPPAADALLGQEAPRLVDVPTSVLPGGREIVLVESHGPHIVFQILDAAGGKVARRASFCLTQDVDFVRLQQFAGRACLLGKTGLIEIDPASWEPQRAIGMAFTDGRPDDAIITTNGRFVWFCHTSDQSWVTYTNYDTERGEYGKVFDGEGVRVALHALLGLPEPRVLVAKDNGVAVQYEPRGSPVTGAQRTVWAEPHSFAAHPRGEGLFALVRDPDDVADEASTDLLPPTRVRWAELDPSGAPRRAPPDEDRSIRGFDTEAPYQVAAALDDRMAFVLYTTLAGERRLLGVGPRPDAAGLAARFDVAVPARVTLAQDAGARMVFALSPHEGGVEAVRLGGAPPVFREPAPPGAPAGVWTCTVTPLCPCAPRGLRLWVTHREETGHRLSNDFLVHLTAEVRKGMIQGTLGERAALVPRHALLAALPQPAFADELAAAVGARYPGDPEMAQIPALRAARAGDWAAVRKILSPLDPEPLPDAAAQHHDHLLGVAHLVAGDVDEARRVLARGARRAGGACDLSIPLALAGLPAGTAPPRPAHAAVRALDAAVRAADDRLAAGDFAGARRALSGLVVREAREVQTLARLSRAWLSEAGPEVDTLARRLALAAFRSAHAEKAPTLRRELPFAGARWDAAALDALDEEARRLLDEERQARLGGKIDAEGAPIVEGEA